MRRRITTAATLASVLALAAGGAVASGHGPGDDHGDDHAGSGTQRSASAARGGRTLFAVMNGANERDPVTNRRGAGDLDGRGSATIGIDGTNVCWGITVANLGAPVAAHIHKGGPGTSGPVVVPLTQPATGDPGASSGCTTVAASLARAIRRHPARYYVNVHTGAYPAGAVRGQLFAQHR
jgi:hypothetical protein